MADKDLNSTHLGHYIQQHTTQLVCDSALVKIYRRFDINISENRTRLTENIHGHIETSQSQTNKSFSFKHSLECLTDEE